MTEAKKLTMVRDFWKHADEGLRAEFARMNAGFRFYTGDQWSPGDLAKLQAEKRPALTINLVLPIVNLLSGIQRQGRQEITVVARKGGLKPLAAVYTQVVRHCLEMTDADYEIADAFLDGVVGGKGWLEVFIDPTEDPVNGDLVLRKVSPFAVREDPDATEYDLNRSGKFVIRDEWMDKESLLLNYPAKRADIEAGGLAIDPASGDVTGEEGNLRWRVRQCWWKSFENRTVLIDTVSGRMKPIADTQREIACAVSARSGRWCVKEWVVPVLNKTVTAGNLVLEDVKDPYSGMVRFPYMRFCPFWADGFAMGVVQNLIGPQEEVNKRRSQALHNLNQTANSGYKVKKALNNYDKHIAKVGSTPGVVLDESRAGGSIERIEPASLSEGHIRASSMSAEDMKEISGANADLLGRVVEGRTESGKAIELRQAQGMKVVECVFDNLSRTQKTIGKGLVEMIRFTDVYSDDEIAAIVAESEERVDTAGLKDRRIGRYGIRVESSSSSPTTRYANFMSILEIARMYPDRVPAEAVIDSSDIENKEKVIDQLNPSIQVNGNTSMQANELKRKKLKMTEGFVNTVRQPNRGVLEQKM